MDAIGQIFRAPAKWKLRLHVALRAERSIYLNFRPFLGCLAAKDRMAVSKGNSRTELQIAHGQACELSSPENENPAENCLPPLFASTVLFCLQLALLLLESYLSILLTVKLKDSRVE